MGGRSQARLIERNGVDSTGNTAAGVPPRKLRLDIAGTGLTRTATANGVTQTFPGSVTVTLVVAGATIGTIAPIAITAGMTGAQLATAVAAAIEAADGAAEAAVVVAVAQNVVTLTCSSPITAITTFAAAFTGGQPIGL